MALTTTVPVGTSHAVKKPKVEEEETTVVKGLISEKKENATPSTEEEEEEEEEEETYYESSEEEQRRERPYKKEIYYDSSESEDYLTETYKNYCKVINDSNGYDVPDRPNLKISDNLVHTYNMKQLERLSRIAIDYYNNHNKTDYVYHSVEKGNKQPARGILYYITFRTTCAEGLQYFQARVLDGIPDEYVEECILKGKPEPMPDPEPMPEPAAKSTEEVHP
ncbi:hypothetical protein LguiB_002108 [Lonicera macranthoides]